MKGGAIARESGQMTAAPARARELRAPRIEPDDVPEFSTVARRVGWIAERIGAGLWHTDDGPVIAEAWGMSAVRVRDYATTAAIHLELVTNGTEKLRRLAALRLENIAHDHETDANARIKASELLLKLTGDLKGGRETPSMTEQEREAAIVASIREPGEVMTRLLREAFSQPGDGLRALLAEFAVVQVGEER